MIKRIKIIVRALAFLLVAALVFGGVSAMCRRSTWAPEKNTAYGYDTYSKLNNLTNFPIDVAAFGTSVCAHSISPLQLYEEYGISAYNIGGNEQPVMVSYFLLQELLKSQSPRVVFLEVLSLFRASSESFYRLGFDGLPFSKNKWTAIEYHDEDEKSESKLGYIFNIYKYHSTWKTLKEYGLSASDKAKDRFLYYGYPLRNTVYNPTGDYIDFHGWMQEESSRIDYYDEGYEYACKFIELCQDEGIQVILFKDFATNWSLQLHNTTQDFADIYDVPFVDFNMYDVLSESGCNFSTDLADASHDNLLGAKKVTKYLGKYLHENYDLPDHRNDPKYSDLEIANERFQRVLLGEQMVVTRDMSSYLDRLWDLNGQDYTVIFSVKDSCYEGLDDNLKSKLRKLGFTSKKLFNEPQHSFIGIWQNGEVLYEDCSKGTKNTEKNSLVHRGVLLDGMKYYVKSAGYNVGNTSSIIIDGTEYSKNSRGFNIVVYDNVNSRVVDSVVFDTYTDAGITYKR